MTLQEIRDNFQARLKVELWKRQMPDPPAELMSDKMTAFYISQAQQDIQRRHSILQSSTSITLVSGTSAYSLPTDFGKVRTVISIDSGGDLDGVLEKISLQELRESETATGTPRKFAISEGATSQIVVYPTPSGSGTLTFYYYTSPNYYQHSGVASQDWGSYPFSGSLKLPAKYSLAVIYSMLSNIFPDFMNLYEKEVGSLRESQLTPRSLNYHFGGFTSTKASVTNLTSSEEDETVAMFTKEARFHLVEGSEPTRTYMNGYGSVTATASGDTVTISSESEFSTSVHVELNIEDFAWSYIDEDSIEVYTETGFGEIDIIIQQ